MQDTGASALLTSLPYVGEIRERGITLLKQATERAVRAWAAGRRSE